MEKVFKSFVIFTIEELEGEAREKAIEVARERAEDCQEFEVDDLRIEFRGVLEKAGFMSPQIGWEMYCQGSGACFWGKVFNENKLARAIRKFLTPESRKVLKKIRQQEMDWNISIVHRGHYYHKNSVTVEMEILNYTQVEISDQGYKELECAIKEWHDEHAGNFFKSLERVAEYFWKEEHVLQYIKESGLRFLSSGKIFHTGDGKDWEEVPDNHLRIVWRRGEREILMHPGELQATGTPIDEDGRDYDYVRTEILVEV